MAEEYLPLSGCRAVQADERRSALQKIRERGLLCEPVFAPDCFTSCMLYWWRVFGFSGWQSGAPLISRAFSGRLFVTPVCSSCHEIPAALSEGKWAPKGKGASSTLAAMRKTNKAEQRWSSEPAMTPHPFSLHCWLVWRFSVEQHQCVCVCICAHMHASARRHHNLFYSACVVI